MLVAAAAVAIAAIALLLPSFVGWHIEDDLRTMRWVLEYRGEPWVALTELHSLHDHVRPATLIATWLGAAISDGAWWGPHVVLLSLQLAGLAGLAVLAARLVGTPWAGVLAAMLALTLDGFEALAGWNAWICSAGELAFGLWGLVALHAALRARRPPLLAIGLLVVAGLFKEPGWLVYPAAGAGMVWTCWRAGSRGWQRLAGLAPIPLGLAGLAITWHPANVYRAAEAPGGWGGNALVNAVEQAGALIDTWPLRVADGLPWWAGLSVPLLFLAAFAAIRGSGAAVVGMLLVLTTSAVMLHFPVVNAVQLLAAGYGLCLMVAAVLRPGQRPVAWLLALLAIGLVHEGVELAVRLAPPTPRPVWVVARDRGDRFAGVGAVTEALGAREAALSGPLGDMELGPLIGLRVIEGGVEDPAARLTLQDRLRLAVDVRSVKRALLDGDLLAGKEVPLVRDRAEGRRRPGGGRVFAAKDTRRDGLAIDGAPAGFLALGMLVDGPLDPTPSVTLAAADGCGNRWTVVDPPTALSMTTIRLRDACRPLSLSWSGPGRSAIERVFLAPLPPPDLSLWQARIEPRRLATPEQREIPPIFEPDVR
ncbi:MAG: hypothetical protein QGH45_23395 [Myxococcota bacterium]|nr:hypothetical protein [Myxococcota bacterium]